MKKEILSRQANRRIGKAMHDYDMLRDGDRILIAVSGGVDSMVLAWLLRWWREKAPIDYSLHAVHIDNGIRPQGEGDVLPSEVIGAQLAGFGVDFFVETEPVPELAARSCFGCALKRRNRLFAIAEEKGFAKIAFGHHKDDLVETLFLNMLYSGNISTMMPRQDLFGGKLSLIRPLAYLEKDEIRSIAGRLGIQPVASLCPLAGDTRRETVRDVLAGIYRRVPDSKNSIFAAMANIREDYIL